jgi:transcriptional regulator with XRE-family HTH domain
MATGCPGEGESATLPAPVPPLRQLRRLKGWTQRELAAAAGMGVATIQRLERGEREPRPGTMRRIAEALGVRIGSVDEFAAPRPERPQGEGDPPPAAPPR